MPSTGTGSGSGSTSTPAPQKNNQNRKPNPSPVNSNKIEIRVREDQTPIAHDKCLVTIRVKLIKHGSLLSGQEVVVEEGLSIIGAPRDTDVDGCVVFQFKQDKKDTEQKINLVISLTGLSEEKNYTVTIPAIVKPAVKLLKPDFSLNADPKTANCQVNLECVVSENSKPLAGLQVICKNDRLVRIGAQKTDNAGKALFSENVVMTNVDQALVYRMEMTTGEFVLQSVTIPALPQKAKVNKSFAPNVAVIPNLKTNRCAITIQCVVTDGTKAIPGLDATCRKGVSLLGTQITSNSGQVSFSDNMTLTDVEQIIHYRIDLPASGEFELIDVTLPVGTPKLSIAEQAEKMSLRSYHDGAGNFFVKIRVLANEGIGLRTITTTWFKGRLSEGTTSKQGELAYAISPINPGDKEKISVSVSGIEHEASLNLRFRRPLVCLYQKYSSEWYLRTNNGRAALLTYLVAFLLLMSLIFGIGGALITKETLRQSNGLSVQEQMNNNMIGDIAPKAKFIPVKKASSDSYKSFTYGLWGATLALFIFLAIYGPLSLREEIADVIAETAENIFENDETHVGDPILERWAADLGLFHSVRNKPKISVQEVANNGDTSNKQSPKLSAGHPTLVQMFKMDMLSDALTTVAAGLLKRIF